MAVAVRLFGPNSFKERNYTDSNGLVDLKKFKGGILKPVVSNEHPLCLSYDTFLKELKVSFFLKNLKL